MTNSHQQLPQEPVIQNQVESKFSVKVLNQSSLPASFHHLSHNKIFKIYPILILAKQNVNVIFLDVNGEGQT